MVHQSVPKIVETTNDRGRMPPGVAGTPFNAVEDNAPPAYSHACARGGARTFHRIFFSTAIRPCEGIPTDFDFGSKRDWIMETKT